jgi:hypothetical protein
MNRQGAEDAKKARGGSWPGPIPKPTLEEARWGKHGWDSRGTGGSRCSSASLLFLVFLAPWRFNSAPAEAAAAASAVRFLDRHLKESRTARRR